MDVDRYQRDGFVALDPLLDEVGVRRLREGFDELLKTGVDGNRMWGGVTRQVMMPCLHHAAFAANAALETGTEVATKLLGAEAIRTFDMLIDKPPGHPHVTPWHQDMAYSEMPFARAGQTIPHESLQMWFALDDTDERNGCMHFVPGIHRQPLLLHRVVLGDPVDDSRLLGIVDPEQMLKLEKAVACPLRSGGATVHSYGTPHFTPPNTTDRPRRAYVINFHTVTTLEAAVQIMLDQLEEQGRHELAEQVRGIVERRDMVAAINVLTPLFRDFVTNQRERFDEFFEERRSR